MEKVKWTVHENEYHLKTPYGVATIFETRGDSDSRTFGASHGFTASFEHQDGIIESSDPKIPFTSFEDAEGWVLWGCVMRIDQAAKNDEEIKRLIASLNLSEKRLSASDIDVHRQRIRLIKQFMRGKRPDITQETRSLKQYRADFHKFMEEFPPLDWQEQENVYSVQLDAGKAVIEEVRNRSKWIIGRVSTYYPRIEDQHGNHYQGLEEFQFEMAEYQIKLMLFEIQHPIAEDHLLEELQATLTACKQALPDDTAPLHFLRLQWIEQRLNEILL
jgi:hypothetical protein